MPQYFRVDTYKCYRGFWFLLGFFGTILPVGYLIRKDHVSLESMIIAIIFFYGFPFILLLIRWFGHLTIDDEKFIIGRILWKVIIPISDIKVLSYRTNYYTSILYVEYLQNNETKDVSYNVEFFNAKTISELNSSILKINSDIKIETDEKSTQKQEKVKNTSKIPATKYDWIIFAIQWFVIGALLQIILFIFLVPKH